MDQNSLRQMIKNRRHIPDILGIWFETLAQIHLTFPKPMAWNDRPKLKREIDPDMTDALDTIL